MSVFFHQTISSMGVRTMSVFIHWKSPAPVYLTHARGSMFLEKISK